MRIAVLATAALLASTSLALARADQAPFESSIDHTLSTDASVAQDASGATPALPLDIKTQGSITYVTGGVGDEELTMLKDKSKDFNLHVLLSAEGGAYVSDVSIHLIAADGTELVGAQNAGPYFYAQLPAGKYKLDAVSHDNVTKSVSFTIGKGSVTKEIKF